MTGSSQRTPTGTVPRIVADFDYAGYGWLVLEWPGNDDEPEPWFEVYREDLPWHWQQLDYEDVR